jgi:protein involved in sex pheromone biosynthesis
MKTTVSKKLAIALITLVWALVGCESDLDKCINEFAVQVGKEKAEQAKQLCVEAQVKTEVDKCSASLVKKIGKEKVEQAKLLCVEAQATKK